MVKLLIVDDSALMRRMLSKMFDAQGDFEIATAQDGWDALARIAMFKPDVVTLDVAMPMMDGLTCLDRIMIEHPCPVVMVSSLTAAGAEVTLEALRLGAVDYVAKPTGAMSLAIGDLESLLVEKVRAASKARLRGSLRLTDRVRRRANMAQPAARPPCSVRPALPAAHRALPAAPMDSVVLVGTSTGGPVALDILLSELSADFPWPVLVAQHMPAAFTEAFARRLNRQCALNVVEVTGPLPIARGTVYIGKGQADIIVSTRRNAPMVMAAPAAAEHRWHPSVDRLVTTAMEHLGAGRLIGVLMTGMGNDGAAAMTRLRAEGGRTIAESEESAVVWGMPGELVKAGGADVVLPLEQIGRQLRGWA